MEAFPGEVQEYYTVVTHMTHNKGILLFFIVNFSLKVHIRVL